MPLGPNGWYDDGKRLNVGSRCWNCKSMDYHETVSKEWCNSCGIKFDYWGSHGNEKYNAALNAKHAQEREEEFRRDYEMRREHDNYINSLNGDYYHDY